MNAKKYRSIFISDVHLGTNDCKANKLNNFLKYNTCDTLYLVGDIIDAWRIQQNKWRWKQSHTNVVRRVLGHAKRGTRVIYIAGNHDEFLRPMIPYDFSFGLIEIHNQIEHIGADGKHYLVTHGDMFDGITRLAPWLAFLGDRAYDVVLSLNNDSPLIIYNKALCLINLGDSKAGLEEFKIFLTSLQIPENAKFMKSLYFPLNMQEIPNSLFVGDFYFSAGFFEEAFEIYENCDIDSLFKLERKFCCLFSLKELSNAIEYLENLYSQSENKTFYFDLQVLLSLKMASEDELKGAEEKLEGIEEEGYVFKKWDVHFFKGIIAFFAGKTKKAYEWMEKAKENLLLESEEIDRTNTIFIYEIEINQLICLIQVNFL